jgi:hypothetical protein
MLSSYLNIGTKNNSCVIGDTDPPSPGAIGPWHGDVQFCEDPTTIEPSASQKSWIWMVIFVVCANLSAG